MLEPTEALESTENALRLIIRLLMADDWKTKVTPTRLAEFEKRLVEEGKRRDGVSTSTDLLAFTDFTDLTAIIVKNWETFKPVFDDQTRLRVYFGLFEDIRNAIAHSRDLVGYERELLSGMATQIRNQIGLFRVNKNPASAHYPVIEFIADSFGIAGFHQEFGADRPSVRLNVGDRIDFSCRGFDARGRELTWLLAIAPHTPTAVVAQDGGVTGNNVELSYVIEERDIGENLVIGIFMASSGKHHLSGISTGEWREDIGEGMLFHETFFPSDDAQYFFYAVNPPPD